MYQLVLLPGKDESQGNQIGDIAHLQERNNEHFLEQFAQDRFAAIARNAVQLRARSDPPMAPLSCQPEISLDTYTKWRCAPPMILDPKIDRDCICSLAISNLNGLFPVRRACYLLVGNKHFDEIERYLVGQAFPRNLEIKTKSPGVSSRAIRILMNTHTAEHLEQITARDFNSI
ncbi:unnamed protein product, partial [Nesidiocoris tenuis]